VKGAFPVFRRVTARAGLVVRRDWLPNVKLLVERLAIGAVPTPVPVRAITCGLPAALSINTTEPVRAPAALGVNVRLRVHWFEGAREEPQLLVKV
jgi:hypothetical protein